MNIKDELIIKFFDKAKRHFFFILKDERIISVSKNIKDILGFNEEEVLNKQIKEFFIDENEYLNFSEYLYKKDKEPLTIRLLSKDKKEKVFGILYTSFEKEIDLIFIILRDITEENEKEKLNQILFKLSSLFIKLKNFDELIKEIHLLIKQLVYAENIYVAFFDESEDMIYFPYFVDLIDQKPKPRKRRGGITEFVIEKDKGVLLKKEEIEKLKAEGKLVFYGTCPESYIGVPLKYNDKCFGIISVQSYDKNITYSDKDLRLISFIAENISLMIYRKKEEEIFFSLIKNINGYVYQFIVEKERFIYLSKKFEEITGYKIEEVLNKDGIYKNIIHPDDIELIEENYKNFSLCNVKTLSLIYRIITKSGEIRWISDNLNVLKKEIEETTVLHGIVTDITEFVKLREDFIHSEKKFKRILDNSKDIIYRYTLFPKRGFEYVNDAVTKITGYTPEDHYNDPDLGFKIVHPEDRNLVEKISKGDITAPIVVHWIRKDGKVIYTEQNNWFIKDKDGNIIAIEGIARDVTERVLLENKIKESEKRYRLLFENAPIGITLTDKDGNILYCNPKWEEIMGYKLEDLKSLSWMELTYPDDIKEDLEKFEKLVKGELYSYSLEKRAVRIDGNIIWINLNVVRVDDENGNFLYEIAMIEDITEKKFLSEKLKESELKFRTIFEKAPIGITLCDREGKLILSNEAFIKMIGYTLSELKEISWRDYTHPEDIDRDWNLFNKLISNEIDSYIIEKRFVRKDGKIINVNLNTKAIFDNDGNFLYEFALIEDITEKKMLLDALYESEKRFRTFFTKNPIGLVIGDDEQNFIETNEVYRNLLGYSEEELKNLRIEDITHSEDYKREIELMYKTKNKEIDSFTLEKRYIRKDGSIFWGQVFVSAFFDEEGNFKYYFGILRDITEEKRLKDELEEAHNKLKKYFDDILKLTTKIIEKKDPYTLGHQAKVAKIATKIAEKLNLSKEKIETTRIASYLHDIGKIVLPSEILNKPRKLTKNEFLLVQEHSKAGYDILKSSDFLYPIAEIVYQHHERLDGSGYPRGLKDDQISLEARIIAVCDVFDAMTSHRPYRPKFSIEETFKELKEKSGILYDKEVVNILVDLLINNEIY